MDPQVDMSMVPLPLFLATLGLIGVLDVLLLWDMRASAKKEIRSLYVPMLPRRCHFQFTDFHCRYEGGNVVLCKTIETDKVLLQITLPARKVQAAMDKGITVKLEPAEHVLRSLEIV